MRFKQLFTEDELQRQKAKQKKRTRQQQFAEPEQDIGPSIDDLKMAGSKGAMAAAGNKRQPAAKIDDLPGKKASRAQTRATNFAMPDNAGGVMGQFMNNMADVTDTADVPANHGEADNPIPDVDPPEPDTPENLPATISKALSMEGPNGPDLTWHNISELPGYAIQQIRGAFRPLFQSIIQNELEDISVSTTLGGDTSDSDMRDFIGFIGHHGTKRDDFQLEAFGIDPEEYKVTKAMVYYLNGFNFYIMKERMSGQANWYVYAGVAKDSNHLSSDDNLPQLT